MWSETVDLDKTDLTPKIGLGLAGPVLCCETRGLVTLVIIMILKDTATF